MDTETIDRLFLELSQFTKARTARELALEVEVARLKEIVVEYDRRIVAIGGVAMNSVPRKTRRPPPAPGEPK